MRACEYCGSDLPDGASFCGYCGRAPSYSTDSPTSGGGLTIISSRDINSPPHINTSGARNPVSMNPQQGEQFWQYQSTPSNPDQDEEEEERRRRAAMLGFGLPLAGGMGQYSGNAPMVQGTPQMGGIPLGHGTPQAANSWGQGAAQSFHSAPTIQSPQSSPPFGARPSMPQHHPSTTPHKPPHPTPSGGCAPIWLIFVIAIVLIIASIIGAGFTVLAPSLSLSGSSNVTLGGTLHLHGSAFLPGSSVTLTVDDAIPLYYSSQDSRLHVSHGTNALMGLAMNAVSTEQVPSASNVVKVRGDGSFDVNIAIGQNWHTGVHTIHASEGLRSADLSFTVHQPGVTVTPSASPSVTVSPSVTTTPTGLTCVNPNSVTFGPVSESYNQPVSAKITLCTTGTGIINWTANWDHNQAPWLQVDPNTGQINASGTQDVMVSAVATGLKASTYTTTVTFTSGQSDKNVTLNVTFIVQAGCISTQPTSLSFSGVAGISDPAGQTVTVTNCGVAGTWSVTVSTDNNTDWLSVSPTGGTVDGQGTQSVTVTASNLKAKLAAGTYTGKVIFSMGSQQSVVNVTLTVQAGPMLVLVLPNNNPPSFNANTGDCPPTTAGNWRCLASISNGSQNQSLDWTASSVPGITFQPASGTLAPGQETRVVISIPNNNCQPPTATITFTGPANTINISWTCTIIR